MGSEYIGPLPNLDAQPQHVPASQPLATDSEKTQPRPVNQTTDANANTIEPSYQEHSSTSTGLHAVKTPGFYPPHQLYQQQQSPMPSYPGWQAYQSPPAGQAQQLPRSGPPMPSYLPWQAYQLPVAGQSQQQAQQLPRSGPPMPSYLPWQAYQLPVAGQPQQQAQQQPYPATPLPSYPPAGYPPVVQYPYGYNGYGYPQPAPPGYPGYNGSWRPPYPPYPYPPGQQSPRPRRDGYQLGVAIASAISSGIVVLIGLVCGLILLGLAVAKTDIPGLGPRVLFSATVIYTALTIIGLIGGSFSLYHSIRALMRRQSAPFKLPWSWLFLVLYVILLAVGFTFGMAPQVLASEPLKILLIGLAGTFPALAFLALAVRRVHYPREAPWTTTWRRFTLAIVSGGTLAILLAGVFELVLMIFAGAAFGIHNLIINDPNLPVPRTGQGVLLLFLFVSVIAPVVEELLKPLTVVVMLGRLRSAAETFILGFACGIGFDLVETSGYIGLSHPRPWIDTALERSTTGLLHGFGAGMAALGWYYLMHRNSIKKRVLIGLGCIAFAIVQHSIWNSAFLFALLPVPVGPYFENGTLQIGSYAMPATVLVYIVESLLLFAFFLLVTRKLRSQQQAPQSTPTASQTSPQPVNPPVYASQQTQ